jgi:hypothetical protein
MEAFQIKDVVSCYVVQGTTSEPVGVLSIYVREEPLQPEECNRWVWGVRVGGFRTQLLEHVPDLALGRAATEGEARQQGRAALREILAALRDQIPEGLNG